MGYVAIGLKLFPSPIVSIFPIIGTLIRKDFLISMTVQ